MALPLAILLYFISSIAGWLIVGTCFSIIRRTIGIDRASFKFIDFWVGSTERSVATTIVFFAPRHLPAFVGGWIALKFAAHWQRKPGNEAERASLVFLIGTVISFAVGIAAGVFGNPLAVSNLNGL